MSGLARPRPAQPGPYPALTRPAEARSKLIIDQSTGPTCQRHILFQPIRA
jgi:hypothetical protein